MKIYVDIDETICFYNNEREYRNAIPSKLNIEKINKLFEQNNEIIYWTARATVHKDRYQEYYDLTLDQLKTWGCKFNKLIIGEKPDYDLLICDKTKRIEEI